MGDVESTETICDCASLITAFRSSDSIERDQKARDHLNSAKIWFYIGGEVSGDWKAAGQGCVGSKPQQL